MRQWLTFVGFSLGLGLLFGLLAENRIGTPFLDLAVFIVFYLAGVGFIIGGKAEAWELLKTTAISWITLICGALVLILASLLLT